jgi:hypothetical protein
MAGDLWATGVCSALTHTAQASCTELFSVCIPLFFPLSICLASPFPPLIQTVCVVVLRWWCPHDALSAIRSQSSVANIQHSAVCFSIITVVHHIKSSSKSLGPVNSYGLVDMTIMRWILVTRKLSLIMCQITAAYGKYRGPLGNVRKGVLVLPPP